MSCATFRNERSASGVSLSVLKSALQKYIRRGETAKAVWVVKELLSFSNAPEGASSIQRIFTNFKHRMMVIFLEDVGDIGAWEKADAFLEEFPQSAIAWTEAMCASKKSRACSHARAIARAGVCMLAVDPLKFPSVYKVVENFKAAPFPSLALALKSKSDVSIVIAHNMVTLSSDETISKIFKAHAGVLDTVLGMMGESPIVKISKKWMKEMKSLREVFLCWMLPLLSYIRDWKETAIVLKYSPRLREEFKIREGWNITDDLYVFDKHVAGFRGDKSLERFLTEGSFVENENLEIVNIEWRLFYSSPFPPPQTIHIFESEFEFVVRCQLTTSFSKTDVYIASREGFQNLFVIKGPFRSQLMVTNSLNMSDWKRQNGLPYINQTSVLMIPDRWPEGVPIGIRSSLGSIDQRWFLISECLIKIPAEEIPKETRASKLWPATEVVDWKSPAVMNLRHSILEQGHTYSQQERIDCVLALIARHIMGIGDIADRNFLRYEGRIYSIDEETRGSRNVIGELTKRKLEIISVWFSENSAYIYDEVSKWTGCANIGGETAKVALFDLVKGGVPEMLKLFL